MASSTGSTSNLQITVEPSQSSFFAGEDFSCVITFTNTLVPAPQSVPLPSTSRFDNDEPDRRAISLGPNALQVPPFSQPLQPQTPPSSQTPQRRRHNKSQSVDIRTFARQNQLQSFGSAEGGAGGEEEAGSDERYYKSMAEERENERGESRELYLQREVLENLPSRKRLIGKSLKHGVRSAGDVVRFSTPPMPLHRKQHQKAFSVAGPGQYDQQHQSLGIGKPATGPLHSGSPRGASQQHVLLNTVSPSPVASRNTSSAARQPSGPIASNHPHSRKKSVAQVQAEDLSAAFELEGGAGSGADSTPTQSLAATPRGSLDLRSRSNTENGQNFYGLGENSTMESVLREDFTQWSKMGQNGNRDRSDSIASSTATSPAEARKTQTNGTPTTPLFDSKNSSSTPGTETLLWTFVQFGGSFQIDESLIKPGEFEQVKERLAGRGGGGVPGMMGSNVPISPVGGGEFGAAMEGALGEDRSAEGWGSYLRGVLSGGGGSRRSLLASAAHRRGGSTLGEIRAKTLKSKSIPIFSNPPSMLAVDLKLGPGESRSYSFRIPLPPDLPPSYTGRSISFAYNLTLGTNRLARTRRGTVEQKSRLVRIPLRVYNLVSITGITSFFDLTNPIVNAKDLAETKEEGKEVALPLRGEAAATRESGRRESKAREAASANELLAYTQQLISSCKPKDDGEDDDVPTDVEVATELARKQGKASNPATSPISRPHLQLLPDLIAIRNSSLNRTPIDSSAGLGLTGDEDELPRNSLQAVEVLSRNSQKVSYDISKDGQVAAVLTLIKSKYRLGDTVHGVVSFNDSAAIARVVRVAATLETHEEIESTLSTLPAVRAQKMTKKVHAEYHENTLDLGQVCFSLSIPSGATPDFVTSAVKLSWTVRLSFLMLSAVRTGKETDGKRSNPPNHLVPSIDDGYSAYHRAYRAAPTLAGPQAVGGGEETKLEVVQCAVPLTVLAHSTRFTAGEVAFVA